MMMHVELVQKILIDFFNYSESLEYKGLKKTVLSMLDTDMNRMEWFSSMSLIKKNLKLPIVSEWL
jgi:hypothetical protein